MSSPQTEALVGRTIGGKLRLEQLLGEGASGAVFRAHHLTLDKPIAVKILHASHTADPNLVSRFKAEARAASRLDHPNSIRILDFGDEDHLLYIAMEFVDGQDLQALLEREHTLEPWRVAAIMAQAAGALALAHDQGVVHRDLKPGNIMLIAEQTEDGDVRELVKVCDFGLAKILDVNPDELTNGPLTKQGVIFGTPAYMAPEQASGEKIDQRADIYAVGTIIFKMLAGRTPFTADNTTGLLMKQIMEPPPPLASVVPGVDPRLATLVDQCLQKDPDDRPQTMHEVMHALRPIAQDAPIDAMPLVDRAKPRSRTISLGAAGPHGGTSDTYERPLDSVGAVPPATNRGPLLLSAIGSVLLVIVVGLFVFVLTGENDVTSAPPPPLAKTAPPKIEPPVPAPPVIAPPVVEPPPPSPPPAVEPPPPKRTKTRRRKKSAPPPPPPPPPKAPPKAPPPPVVAPPPPTIVVSPSPKLASPPPPLVKLSPSVKLAPKATNVSVDFDVTSISGGLSRKRTADALQRGLAEAKQCLEKPLLAAGRATTGQVDVSAKISVRGKLGEVRASGAVGSACVQKAFNGLRMPRPDTGAAYVKFRLRYVVK